MLDRAVHPHTRAIINAWRRLSSHNDETEIDPKLDDFPNLLGSLFLLKRDSDGMWTFSTAGKDMNNVVGRELLDHDFLSLWSDRDQTLINAQLEAVREGTSPGILRARGEALSRQMIEIEVTLAPLRSPNMSADRILGLYQPLGGEGLLNGRPVWRHTVNAIYPPEAAREETHLRLVASV